MKSLVTLLTVLLLSIAALAAPSTTAVTATLQDTSTQVWSNANWTTTFQPPAGNNNAFLNNGIPVMGPQSGTANGSGVFTVTLDDNLVVAPSGSKWLFTICPNATAGCVSVAIVITGASQNVSSTINAALAPPVVNGGPSIVRAYTDAEVSGSYGTIYFNTVSNTLRQCPVGFCAGASWAAVGGGALSNALTMNNSGTGAASGTTFDGSVARTLSYNTLGAAPTASPTFTGTTTFPNTITIAALNGSQTIISAPNDGATSLVLTDNPALPNDADSITIGPNTHGGGPPSGVLALRGGAGSFIDIDDTNNGTGINFSTGSGTSEFLIEMTPDPTGGIQLVNQALGSNNVDFIVKDGGIQLNPGKWLAYNTETTAGVGMAYERGSTSQKNETGVDANILTVTPASAVGLYRISVVFSVSAANTATLGWTATWTDSNAHAQAQTNLALFKAGTAAPALTFSAAANDTYYGSAIIDVNNAGTNIVIKSTFTGTSIAYKASATVERLQ